MPRKSTILLVIILLLAALLRVFLLGQMPIGVTNDEANYIYSAFSIWHTGHDIAGKFLPLSFNIDNSFSPVPVYLIAPFVGLFGMSAFVGRLPFAIAGVGSVLLVYLITKKLFNNSFIALASAFVMAVNPWHLQVSRIAYEAGLALFFILLGTYIFLRNQGKSTILWSLLPFLLGFYSYHGTKVFFIFFVPLLIWFGGKELFKRKKELIAFVIGFFLICGSYILIAKMNHDTRQIVFFWNDAQKAAETVNWERSVNTAPHILKPLFNNKLMYYLRLTRENYFQIFSPQFLFLFGETGGLAPLYGTFFRGVFYMVELPFLIWGFFFLYNFTNKRVRNFLYIAILIAPLPSAFTFDRTYVMRSIMLLPLLSIVIGCGVYAGYVSLAKRSTGIKRGIIVLSCLVYGFFVAGYVYQYYFRYRLYAAENWFGSSRDLAYVMMQKHTTNQILLANPGDVLIQYAFYRQLDPTMYQKVQNVPLPKTVDNITFLRGCIDTKKVVFDPTTMLPPHSTYIVPDICHPETRPDATITDKADQKRVIWKIYQRN